MICVFNEHNSIIYTKLLKLYYIKIYWELLYVFLEKHLIFLNN